MKLGRGDGAVGAFRTERPRRLKATRDGSFMGELAGW
jgi:hypothetical protein